MGIPNDLQIERMPRNAFAAWRETQAEMVNHELPPVLREAGGPDIDRMRASYEQATKEAETGRCHHCGKEI